MNELNLPIVLAEYLAKSAFVIALGFVLLAVTRKFFPSAAKHSLWIHAFGICLAIPLLLVIFPRWGFLPDLSAPTAIGNPAIEIGGNPEIYTTTFTPDGGHVIPAEKPEFTVSWPWIFSAIWISGVIFLAIQAVFAAHFLRKIERSSKPAGGRILKIFSQLNSNSGRDAKLLISPHAKSPFTWGLFRPRIVLPAPAENWPVTDLQMILLHELEHVRRRDAFSVFLSRMFLALNWANPLAWLANRQAVRFREEACDAFVLKSGHTSESYAEMLFRQAKSTSNPFLQTCATAVAETGTIESRIKMILNPTSKNTSNSAPESPIVSKWFALVAFSAAFVIGLAGCEKPAEIENADTDAPEEIRPDTTRPESPGLAKMNEKLDSIILPSVEFVDTPLADGVEFLRMRSVELDTIETDPDKRGINMIVAPGRLKDAQLTLRLSNVPLRQALIYVAELGQGGLKVEEHAVTIGYEKTAPSVAAAGNAENRIAEIKNKLKTITIPSLEFKDTPLPDALAFLVQRSVELDAAETDPDRKGINIILKAGNGAVDPFGGDPFAAGGGPGNPTITLKLSNVPLAAALKYTCELAGLEYEVSPNAVMVIQKQKNSAPKNNDTEEARDLSDPFG